MLQGIGFLWIVNWPWPSKCTIYMATFCTTESFCYLIPIVFTYRYLLVTNVMMPCKKHEPKQLFGSIITNMNDSVEKKKQHIKLIRGGPRRGNPLKRESPTSKQVDVKIPDAFMLITRLYYYH